jgi:DnaD/phage-associated family protein
MTSFNGFPPGRMHFTRIPDPFFIELLPQIDDLGELKITLYILWRLDRMEGSFRYLRTVDFTGDQDFMAGLAETEKKARTILNEGLAKAVARGTLLQAPITLNDQETVLYFLNTTRGQAAVKAIQDGDWRPSDDPQYPVALNLERPNIFRLYEEHIGPLTPMLAEALQDAENEYPAQWIEEAIRRAVENNVRKWRYVEAILKRWQEEGKDAGRDQRDPEKDRKKYTEGEFSDFIES